MILCALLATLAAATAAPAQAAPTISIDDVSVDPEGATGMTKPATFTISLSEVAPDDVTVRYATAGATAASPADFIAVGSTLVTIPAGQTSTTVNVTVNGDALDEADETFAVQLSLPTNATLLDASGVATIVDDDPVPALSVSDPSVVEGGANLVFTVTLTPVSGRTVTVDYATADGTATSIGAFDFTAVNGTLSFAPGVTTQTVSVPIASDSLDELDETLFLDLTLPAGSPATIAKARGTGTITDDDGPTISINDVTINPEGAAAATTPATFTISLSAPSVADVKVKYATTNGTAVAPADYTAVALTEVTIPAGETTKTVTVTVAGDALDEADETFQVQLSAPVGATILDAAGIATIVDDDPVPALSVSDPSVAEGTGTSRNLVFTVTLTPVSGRTVTVDYTTADGTAVSSGSPIDYTARNGTLSFSPGVTTLTVSVALTTDSLDELDETLFLDLTLPASSQATISKAPGTGTIVDDDGPTIAVNDITVAEGDTGTTTATFTVTLSATSVQAVTAKVATANDTAGQPKDYTALPTGTLVTVPAGLTMATISVTVVGDTLDEADERFRVNLTEPVGGTLSDATGLATITDNDASPVMRVEDLSINEGSVGATNAVVKVTLDKPSERVIIVAATTTEGSATSGVDFGDTTELLTFNTGQVERTLTIPIGPDGAVENDETFTVTLSTPSNATLEKGTATITIVDDDLGPGTIPTLSVADVKAPSEGDSGTKPVDIVVKLSSPPGRTVTVNYTTDNGTAIAPVDYTARSGSLEFAPGETSKTITTTIEGDTEVEADQTFKLLLSSPTNATIGDGQAFVLIPDDDVGLGPVTTPATVKGTGLLCARRKGCSGLPVGWTVYARGRLIFELAAVSPKRTIPARGTRKARTIAAKVTTLLKTTSTITRPRKGRTVLRPTPGRRATRQLRRLRSSRANQLRLKVTFVNRSGESESTTLRVPFSVFR